MTPTHYCTYCAYYGFTYEGSRRQVLGHAAHHPIGSPLDMVLPVEGVAGR